MQHAWGKLQDAPFEFGIKRTSNPRSICCQGLIRHTLLGSCMHISHAISSPPPRTWCNALHISPAHCHGNLNCQAIFSSHKTIAKYHVKLPFFHTSHEAILNVEGTSPMTQWMMPFWPPPRLLTAIEGFGTSPLKATPSDSSNPCHTRIKWQNNVGVFVGCVVLVQNRNIMITLQSGSFPFPPEPIGNSLQHQWCICAI